MPFKFQSPPKAEPKGRKLPPHKDGKGPLAQLFERKGK